MQASTSRNGQDTTCARCGDTCQPQHWLCPSCWAAEPRTCARCHTIDATLHGLCATCQADELGADVDADAAILYALTAQGRAALAQNTAPAPPAPETAPQSQCGPLHGEAACPHCGKVRGAVLDGDSTRCFGCWRSFVPTTADVREVAW